MANPEFGNIERYVEPPFASKNVSAKANQYQEMFGRLLERQSEPNSEQLQEAFGRIEEWLGDEENQTKITYLIKEWVTQAAQKEKKILSESHDMLHLAEIVTSLLDDKNLSVETDNTTATLTVALALLHDLGRTTEKALTSEQIDLSTNLHHDTLSYRAARKILTDVSQSMTLPETVRNAFSDLIFFGLRHFGESGKEQFLSVASDGDRRQLLGSPTVGRDILYYGGMMGRDLSPKTIFTMPAGYTHYDSGGFFGQQNTMARSVFRDESIRQSRGLDAVYDELATEAATIVLLGCGNNEKLEQRAFDVDLGLISVPGEKLIDQDQKPWWPKKILPNPEIFDAAKKEQAIIEGAISEREITAQDLDELVTAFVRAYSTIIEPQHIETIRANMQDFSNAERIAWARILYFADLKNTQRYNDRIETFFNQQSQKTFLAKITAPFIEILQNKKQDKTRFGKAIHALWPSAQI